MGEIASRVGGSMGIGPHREGGAVLIPEVQADATSGAKSVRTVTAGIVVGPHRNHGAGKSPIEAARLIMSRPHGPQAEGMLAANPQPASMVECMASGEGDLHSGPRDRARLSETA